MNHTILLKEPFQVCGLSVKLSGSQNENSKLIQNLWQLFNRELRSKNITSGKNWKKYGVTYQSKGCYIYIAAIPFNISYKGFSIIEISGGKFASFQHVGAMNLLKSTYYNIYKKLLPKSSLLVDKNRYVLHYEVYDNRFNWNKADSTIDIIIPIK